MMVAFALSNASAQLEKGAFVLDRTPDTMSYCDDAADALVQKGLANGGTNLSYTYKGAAKNLQPLLDKYLAKMDWKPITTWVADPALKVKIKTLEQGPYNTFVILKGGQVCFFSPSSERFMTQFFKLVPAK